MRARHLTLRLAPPAAIVAFGCGGVAAAANDQALLKQAQELFKPLPRDMAT